jgi:hypothetical protein
MLERFFDLYPQVDETILLERAAALSEVLGKEVRVRFADGSTVEGRALRLVRGGALELEVDSGSMVVGSGEVESFREA